MTREFSCTEGMMHGAADKGWLVRAGSSISLPLGIRPVLAGKKVYDRDRKSGVQGLFSKDK